MSAAVAIGDGRRLAGFALAGADVRHAADDRAVLAAWEGLGDDVALLVLTPEARAALGGRPSGRPGLVLAVLPA